MSWHAVRKETYSFNSSVGVYACRSGTLNWQGRASPWLPNAIKSQSIPEQILTFTAHHWHHDIDSCQIIWLFTEMKGITWRKRTQKKCVHIIKVVCVYFQKTYLLSDVTMPTLPASLFGTCFILWTLAIGQAARGPTPPGYARYRYLLLALVAFILFSFYHWCMRVCTQSFVKVKIVFQWSFV